MSAKKYRSNVKIASKSVEVSNMMYVRGEGK